LPIGWQHGSDPAKGQDSAPARNCYSAKPVSPAPTGDPFKNRFLTAASILLIVTILAVAVSGQAAPVNGFWPTPVRAANRSVPAPSQEVKLTLRVYNYARVDTATLASSEKVASAIFGDLGIETIWVDCALWAKQAPAYPACLSEMGPTDFVLRLLPRRMAKKLPASGEPLGFAQQCPATEPACELNVFYFRVDELAAKGYRADQILGYVIAHEVAHSLLGPGHSDAGLMRGEWSRDDLQHISWGLAMRFTSDQSRMLRSAILRRTVSPAPDLSTQAKLFR
jgi:hypothetical protein